MRQAIKSATMRTRIIDATIRCLVKYGYARTTTLKVAEEAGVSRGAMMHHFDNAAALIYAAAEELHRRRLKSHVRRAKEIDHRQVSKILHQSWNQFAAPVFLAFLELAMAARTDESLAAILLPLQRQYSERWYHQARELYPEWDQTPAGFDLAFSLSQVMLHGMALTLATASLPDKMIEPLLRHLEGQVRDLRGLEGTRRSKPHAEAGAARSNRRKLGAEKTKD